VLNGVEYVLFDLERSRRKITAAAAAPGTT
jgi:hypothetical protein